MENENFVVNKEALHILYKGLNYVESNISNTNSDLYTILRNCMDLTSNICNSDNKYAHFHIDSINNTLRRLHPSYKMSLEYLRYKLKQAYNNYIYKITELLNCIENILLHNTKEYFNINISYASEGQYYNKFNKKIYCKLADDRSRVVVNINIDGNIYIKTTSIEKNFLFEAKNDPLKEYNSTINDLFLKNMDELNFQYVVDSLNDKVYLYNKSDEIRQELYGIDYYLRIYSKYGLNVKEL